MEQAEFQPLVLELLKSLREDLNQFKTDTNRQFDRIHEEQRIQGRKLEEVYQARNRVKVSFGMQWTFASILIAIGASTITQIFN